LYDWDILSRKEIPHLSALTVPADKPRKAARHGKIEQIFEDVFVVRGKMPSTPCRPLFERLFLYYSRTMTVIRCYDDEGKAELTLFNTLRLNDRALMYLAELGAVKNIVRLGSFHGVDDAFYVDRFNAKYWIVDGMTSADGLRVSPDVLSNEGHVGLPIADSKLFDFDGLAYPEAIYLLPATGSRPGLAITTDSIQNHTTVFDIDNSPLVSLAIWRIGLAGEARLGPIWLREQTPKIGTDDFGKHDGPPSRREISAFLKPQFERLLETCDFDALIAGHGWPIRSAAKAAIRRSIEDQLGTRE
jgi:hypothetical protein